MARQSDELVSRFLVCQMGQVGVARFAMYMSVLPEPHAAPLTPVNLNLDPPGYSTLDGDSEDDEIWANSPTRSQTSLVDAVSSE